MNRWWGRMVYSLACTATAAVLAVGSLMLADSLHLLGGRSALLSRLSLGAASALIGLVFTFSLPGWLLGLPFVLAVKDLRGGRFWLWLAIGTCIGPLLIAGIVLFRAQSDPQLHFVSSLSEAMFFVYLAAGVSCLTTLIYLLLLRWAQKQEAKRHVVIEDGTENPGL